MTTKQKVWCICDGDGYNFHGIVEIFSTKEKAEAYLETHRSDFSRDEVCIYEEELDPE